MTGMMHSCHLQVKLLHNGTDFMVSLFVSLFQFLVFGSLFFVPRRLQNSSLEDSWWRTASVSKVICSHLDFLATEASQSDHCAADAADADAGICKLLTDSTSLAKANPQSCHFIYLKCVSL